MSTLDRLPASMPLVSLSPIVDGNNVIALVSSDRKGRAVAEATYGGMMKLLESLPPKSVVVDHDQDAWQKDDEGLWTCTVRVANTEAMSAESVAIMGLLEVVYVGARADGCRCYPGRYCGGPDCAPDSEW